MRNNLWIGSGISGMGEIPILGRPNKSLSGLIKSMFKSGAQGFAYDPNDLSTLYQDAAGTIPVTAAGQPVGLMFDKSKGVLQGIELQPTNNIAGFSTGQEHVSYGDSSFTTTNASHGVSKRLFIVGKWYVVSVSGSSTTSITINTSDSEIPVSRTQIRTGFGTCIIRADMPFLYLRNDAGGTTNITSISVREISGNHAYQSVSASRPILQQTPILGNELLPVSGSFDAGGVGWLAGNGGWTYTAGAAVSTGGLTGYRYIMPSPAVTSVGKTYTISMVIRSKGTQGSIGVSFNDGGGFSKRWELKDIVNGSVLSHSGIISGNAQLYIMTTDGWDGSIESVSIKEVLGYHEDQNYLAFDGVDDSLQTNNIDFTGTDKVSLFAGVRKLNDATTAMLVELSIGGFTAGQAGNFYISAPHSAYSRNYALYSRGSITHSSAALAPASYLAPISNVIGAKASISGDNQVLRIDGKQVAQSLVDQGTGNYGNHPLYIGRRGGTSIPFSGHLYSLIGIGRLTTDSETATLEKVIAKNTGVTLNV